MAEGERGAFEDDRALPGEMSRFEHVQASVDRSLRYVDITAAILLSIATVATAWCAYQSARWGGVQAASFAQASATRLEANIAYNVAFTTVMYDTLTYIELLNARMAGDQDVLAIVENELIREDFQPYIDQLDASIETGDASSPIEDDSYGNALLEPAIFLEELAGEFSNKAAEANQTSDDYVLATVLFASVLFFAGISNKFERLRIQGALVLMGGIMLVLGFVQIAGLPIH